MPFDYDHTSLLHEAILGPMVRWFEMVNGRKPEPDDIAFVYPPYIPLQMMDQTKDLVELKYKYIKTRYKTR